MTTLSSKTPSASYGDLLQISNSNGGIDATARNIEDGQGTASPLQLATDSVNISNGVFTLTGTGRVYKNEWVTMGAIKLPGTKPAAYVDHGIGGAYEFSDATDDTVVAVIRLPQDMDKTEAPEIKLGWTSATADPGDDSKQVVWQVEYLYCSAGEDTTAAAQDTVSTTTSMSTATNGLVISTIALDAPATADQLLLLRIKRLGADGDDDLGDTALLLGCGMKYTVDKLGAALS